MSGLYVELTERHFLLRDTGPLQPLTLKCKRQEDVCAWVRGGLEEGRICEMRPRWSEMFLLPEGLDDTNERRN